MKTTNVFEYVEFFGMSSYDKHFVGIWKYMDLQLFNAPLTMFLWHLVMFLHFETYALANPQKAYFSGGSGCQFDLLPHISRIPLTRGEGWPGLTPFEGVLIYISDFWGCFWSPEAIKISTDSWGDVLHDLIIYVSRSGKFTAFYIPYISHIAQKPSGGCTMKSTTSRIWGGIHENISF